MPPRDLAAVEAPAKPRVLCVDDEPSILQGLALTLRRRFEVFTAPGGAEGLELLARTPGVTVILSDMRMPGMSGAAFLAKCRTVAPDATRMLLTGQADLSAAIAAINDGRVFRFLSKPCTPEELIEAILHGVEQHRMVTAERVLLEETLQGSVRALADVLAQTHPKAFGRGLRVKRYVSALAEDIGLQPRWQVEVAAMLSQLGVISLPEETREAWEAGAQLTPDEADMVARMPAFADRLLSNIPRLESVRAILTEHRKHPSAIDALAPPEVAKGARILRIVVDYDAAEARGLLSADAFTLLQRRGDLYDCELLDAFADVVGAGEEPVQRLALDALRPGMVLAEDLRTQGGVLLAARGYQLSSSFVGRLENLRQRMVREPISVTVPRTPARREAR